MEDVEELPEGVDSEEHEGGVVGGDSAHAGRGEEVVVEVDQVSTALLYWVNLTAGAEIACDWGKWE